MKTSGVSVDSLSLDSDEKRILCAVARSPSRAPPPHNGASWGEGGRYVIERSLGRGGMGTVYLASDTRLARQVALKVLETPDEPQDEADRARLLREARVAAHVEHERIARVYDVGDHEGCAFVAMEYVRGSTLRAWMGTPRSPADVLKVLGQIAEGLSALHAAGVVHRDLKPENIMLGEDGGVKVLDFGLAGQLEARAEPDAGVASGGAVNVGTARSSAFRGTPGYMAPEQLLGQSADARADVFALGVIVSELVTGRRPFEGASMLELSRAIKDPPRSLQGPAWSRYPASMAVTTARMLASDKSARYADAAEVWKALRRMDPVSLPRGGRWRTVIAVLAGLTAATLIAPRVARKMTHLRALAHPPSGMAAVDEGAIPIGQTTDYVTRECAELGAKCPEKVLRYQIPRATIDVGPFFLDVREVTNREMADALTAVNSSLHVERDEDDHTLRYVRFEAALGKPEGYLVDLHPVHGGIEFLPDRSFRARAGQEEWPAVQVTWYGAKFYCQSQGKRLPTENEWEAAARGHDDRLYPWGDAAPRCGEVVLPNDGYLTIPGCPGEIGPADVQTATQDVTPGGIRDLGGSVAEWVDTAYAEDGRDRQGVGAADSPRVIRGGSYFFSLMARTSMRNKRPANTAHLNVGVRCAADVR